MTQAKLLELIRQLYESVGVMTQQAVEDKHRIGRGADPEYHRAQGKADMGRVLLIDFRENEEVWNWLIEQSGTFKTRG